MMYTNNMEEISPTVILQDHINMSKRETREMIEAGGLDCITRGVFGLLETAGDGNMKAVDIVINRVDGLLSDTVALKPVVVEIIDYGK